MFRIIKIEKCSISVLLFFLHILKVQPWNYIENSDSGPKKWSMKYPHCQGSLQSPINILPQHLHFSTQLLSFELPGYESIPEGAHWDLYNNGNYLQIRLKGDYVVREGGLNGEFRAVEMNFRWGKDPKQGSEHVLNGTSFPMELQILHYNTKYASYDEAALQPDGLAAFAFLFKVKERDNPTLMQVTKNFKKVQLRDQSVPLRPVPLLSLLPINLNDYYRYEGSLTHPPCMENVLWTVFTEHIDISMAQLSMFRKLLMRGYKDGDVLLSSKRALQPLHDRVVYSSRNQDATIWTAPLSPISITLAVFLGFVILFLVLGKQQKLEIEDSTGRIDDESLVEAAVYAEDADYPPQPSTAAYNGFSNSEHHLD